MADEEKLVRAVYQPVRDESASGSGASSPEAAEMIVVAAPPRSWRFGLLAVVGLLAVGVAMLAVACDFRLTVTSARKAMRGGQSSHNMVVIASPETTMQPKVEIVTDADEEFKASSSLHDAEVPSITVKHNASSSNHSRREDHNETKAAHHHKHHKHHKPACDVEQWPDKDHGLVCNDCKVLVNQFSYIYDTCDNYCHLQGRQCTGAWEEKDDNCEVLHDIRCNESLFSSDAICECGTEVNATLKSVYEEKVDNKRAALCGPMEDGFDYWTDGSIASKYGVESAEKCASMCQSHPGCEAWTWGKKELGPPLAYACYLKRVDWGHKILKHPKKGLISGHPWGPHCERFKPSFYTRKPPHKEEPHDHEESHHKPDHEESHHKPQHHHKAKPKAAGTWQDAAADTHGVIKSTHGFCLEAADPHKNDGDIQMMTCTPGSKAQLWTYSARTGQIRNKEGLCLATEAREDLSRLRTLDCDTEDWNQQWDFFPDTATIKNWRGPCLDAAERKIDGGMVYLRTCNKHNINQQWAFGPLDDMTFHKGTVVDHPMSLYCFALMLPNSYEQGLLAMQYNTKISLFACEAYSVYSNSAIEVTPGLTSGVVDSDLKCKKGGEFGTALNLPIFLAVWKEVINDGIFMKHDWTVKVDPDAVFIPERLRGIVANYPETHNGVYLNNCKYGLHGPIEVLSRNAVISWSQGSKKCVDHFWKLCHGDCLWGEDLFIDQCLLKVLDVRRENDYRILMEDHCDPPKDWDQCTDSKRAAFHPFKKQDAYRKCMDNATASAASG